MHANLQTLNSIHARRCTKNSPAFTPTLDILSKAPPNNPDP